MANVPQLTAGLDNLNGIAGDYNIFQSPATLQSTDTVTGGAASPFVDNLEVTATGTLAAAQFQGVTGVEQLILSSAGNNVTLTNALVAGTSTGNFRVEGGAGDDTVDASFITNFTPVSFIAGTGNDSFKGGNGRSDSVFAANALTSADTVVGGAAADFLYFLTAGAVAVDAFANVSAIEGIVFDSGGNSVTLTDSLVSGSSVGVFRIGGGAGDDVVDASAVSATALTFIAGTGADKITAGSSNGNYVFADLTAADTVQGGSGIETVDFANAGAVSAADFANVTNIEGLVLNAGGSDVTLTNSLVAGTSTGFFWILGGAGSDTVDASAISNGTAVSFLAGSGADTFKGGNGRNDSVFAADELTSADTVTGGSFIDTLYFLTPGEVAATAFANVTDIEGLGLDPGGNTVTLTDSLVAGSSIGSFRVGGGAGADIVDASAISNATPITFATGSGANNLKGGNGFDVFLVPDSTFADIDGNDGFDRITATTAAQSLDLTANATKIHDIEIIDLASSAGATLTLTAADIGLINPGAGTSLYVLGGADDTVSTDGGWTLITTTHTNPSVAPGNFTQLQHSSGRNLFLQNGIDINDAPTVVVDSGAETIFTLEDQSIEICNTTFGDVDSGTQAVAVTFAATRGTLSALDTVGDGDGVTVGGIGTSTLTLTGSVADINAFVLADNVVYTPLSNDSGDVTLTTTIDDQGQVGAGGPLSASVNRTITITPVIDGADVRAGAGFLQPTIGVEDPLNGFAFSTLNYRFAPPGNLDETDPRTFALDDGGFVMVWTQSTGTPGILAQRFGANGNPEDSIIAVSPTAAPGA